MSKLPALTIVTYHYIRDIAKSRWTGIKGLEISAFKGQLDYLQRNHTFVGADLLFRHARGEDVDWPSHPVLLTFDDGYIDHFETAFAELQRRGISGAFFAPTRSLLDRCLLDVNKVHFVLAAEPDHGKLAAVIDRQLADMLGPDGVEQISGFRDEMFKPSRWDPAETVYIKRVLQRGPPAEVRSEIASRLFRGLVTADEEGFAEELYLSPVQAREMIAAGMHFGSHGDQHIWFNHATHEEQKRDISASLRLQNALNLDPQKLSFCYPYGGYSPATLDLLRSHGFTLGFTTRLGINWLGPDTSMLELARIDAGADVPSEQEVQISKWSRLAQS